MATPTWHTEVRAHVEDRLARFFDDRRREAARWGPSARELLDAVAELTLRGGKRLRPAVLVAAYRAVAPEGRLDATADAGAALELLQSFLLIHDDIMDGDEERRGGPATHAALAARHGDRRLGTSLGMLAGDLASGYAWELLLGCPWPAGRLSEVVAAFGTLLQEVILGQQLDLLGSHDVSRMHRLKTTSYTVLGPIVLGGLLGNATARQLRTLRAFAEPIGEAFQIRDDLLGTFGDARKTGKGVGNDLRAGKRTALIRAAEQRLSQAERSVLDAVLGNLDATDDQITGAVHLLDACGAREAAETSLDQLKSTALEALEAADLSPIGRQMLEDVAHLLAFREA